MAENAEKLEGPDFEKGCDVDKLTDGEMFLGHAFGEPVLVARRGNDLFAIGAICTHYGGPLVKGLMVDCTVALPVAPCSIRSAHGRSDRGPRFERCKLLESRKTGQPVFCYRQVR